MAAIDRILPEGGLLRGALHEVAGGGKVLWCMTRMDLFAQAGVAPTHVVYVECGDKKALLACFQEGLRHPGLGAVVAEVSRLSMTASRRLQLAAEASGTLGLAVRCQTEAAVFGIPFLRAYSVFCVDQIDGFLLRLAPELAAPVSGKNMLARWNEVIAAADACAVARSSLVALAALSSVVVPKGRSPANLLLKFKPSYTEADAYNALADLHSLDILLQFFAWFPSVPTTFCTADRNLALFWSGLRPSDFEVVGRRGVCNLSPVEPLLPGAHFAHWCSWAESSPVP